MGLPAQDAAQNSSQRPETHSGRTQKTRPGIANFDVSYDLRGCERGFPIVWRYYQALSAPEGGRAFTESGQLRKAARAAGRFPSREAIPELARISGQLGASSQIFAQLLWRDRHGKDRAYIFSVQRNLDVYGKFYYPFTVFEDHSFPWNAWQNRQGASPACEESGLFKAIPRLPFQNSGLRQRRLTFTEEPHLRFIAREVAPSVPPPVADTTVLLAVDSAEQLCKWLLRHGERVLIPARQLGGSSAWRFQQQKQLPFGLTRLKLYRWGAPQKPYPLAYVRYDAKGYALLASFEHGYRLRYLPTAPQNATAQGNPDSIQVTGSVIFWLEAVQQLPGDLPDAAEDFTAAEYDFPADCTTNAHLRAARKRAQKRQSSQQGQASGD